ncbi:MAG: hypothetical protein ABJA02_09990 [Acidobacteriota bacterium]
MKTYVKSFTAVTLSAMFILAMAGLVHAQRRDNREVRDAIRSLTSKIDSFDQGLTDQLRSSSASRDIVGEASSDIRALRSSVSDFQTSFDQKRETRDDANRIVDSARAINGFLVTYPQNRAIDNDWNSIRSQVERLTSSYGITPGWDDLNQAPGVRDQLYPVQKNTVRVGLSGTYSLDAAKSESLDDAIGNINITSSQRQDLKEKLDPPAQIAIDIRGDQVTLATSNASPVTIVADGRDKSEPDGKGATIRLKAALNGSDLVVSSLGGETDYTVTFTSLDSGRTLKVSRRMTTEYLDQTVFAESIYNKSDNNAGLGIDSGKNIDPRDREPRSSGNSTDQNGGYSDNDQGSSSTTDAYPSNGGSRNNGRPTVTGRTGDFVVPNGAIITATLESEINTNATQNNDRFRMTVQSPNEFRGATIEGYVSNVNRSGRATGRSNVTFNFEKITLANGKTYDFAGNLQSLTDQTGKLINVDSEGMVQGGNQTVQTAKRGGVGAGIGAIIGAIAGGGTGAAIGAAIGAGAGAGTVIAQGRSDIQLMKGSTMTIQSSSPIKQSSPPIDN